MANATLQKACGDKWPRMLPPTWAASYCGLAWSQFQQWEPAEEALKEVAGQQRYDRNVLDAVLDQIKEARKCRK